jgi:hypothetical protein
MEKAQAPKQNVHISSKTEIAIKVGKKAASNQFIKWDQMDASSLGRQAVKKPMLTKVFFKSVKKSSTKESAVATFSSYGEIATLQFPFKKSKGLNLGYGIVIFKDRTLARHLIDVVRQVDIDGTLVKVEEYAIRPPRQISKISQFDSSIRSYFRNEQQPFFSLEPPNKQTTQPTSSIGPPNKETTQKLQWDAHAIKPNHSLYFAMAGHNPAKCSLKPHLLFKVKRP